MLREYEQFEKVQAVGDLTLKQRAQLLRIGAVTKSKQLLGPNGKKLCEQVQKEWREQE